MKALKFIIATGFFMSSAMSMAAITPTQLVDTTKVAVDKFLAENPAHKDNLYGYKVWQSGDDVKAKIYVQHDGMNIEFNYTCHDHSGTFECHDQ